MAGVRVHVVFSRELVARVDAACPSGVSRGGFVRGAVEQALSDAKEPSLTEQAGPGSVPPAGGVRPAAPAEQSFVDGFSAEVRGLASEPPLRPAAEKLRRQAEHHGWVSRGAPSSGQAKRGVGPVPKKKG